MRRLALLAILATLSACMAFGGSVIITLHDTSGTTINLSSILGVWGVPGDNPGLDFTPTTNFSVNGTQLFGALNLKNDVGTITSIQIYAYGSIADSSLGAGCSDGSGFNVNWTCTSPADPGKNVTLANPIKWSFTNSGASDPVNLNDIFKIVDVSGPATGAKLIWNVEINGIAPGSPVATPEPTTVLPLAGLFALGFVAYRRKSSTA